MCQALLGPVGGVGCIVGGDERIYCKPELLTYTLVKRTSIMSINEYITHLLKLIVSNGLRLFCSKIYVLCKFMITTYTFFFINMSPNATKNKCNQ